ncbi:hypothetical protein EC988_004005, partial [Linderina pennispora]
MMHLKYICAFLVDTNPTNSELASLGGLLQALGAGVIGNGALIYPTGPSSHQRAEAEVMASDSATRIFKKVKSAIKDGGLNDEDGGDGDDNHKSLTYLVKPALIFHREEIPPPNPLAGNVMPLPGGALLYTPTPTASGAAATGALANIKAAYGNLFAASPYTPSYTLNQPHAAVIVEEITDMLSLKSSLQRLEDEGEDVNDSDEDDEDEYGRKRRGRKSVEVVMLETIESTTPVINPFTRPDFPFGLMTPPTPAATPASSKKGKKKEGESEGDEDVSVTHRADRKTIRRTVNIKTTSTVPASTPLSASVGKDGSITIVGNIPTPSSSTPDPNAATTIVVPGSAARVGASSSSASPASSSSAAPASSSSHEPESHEPESHEPESHESGKGEGMREDVARVAQAHSTSSAKPDIGDVTVGGNRRVATDFDPLMATASVESTASTQLPKSSASPATSATAQSSKSSASLATTATASAESSAGLATTATASVESAADSTSASAQGTKRRKMHVVRVYQVKKKSAGSSSVSAETSKAEMRKRDEVMDKADFTITMPNRSAAALGADEYEPTNGVRQKVRAAEDSESDEEEDAEEDVRSTERPDVDIEGTESKNEIAETMSAIRSILSLISMQTSTAAPQTSTAVPQAALLNAQSSSMAIVEADLSSASLESTSAASAESTLVVSAESSSAVSAESSSAASAQSSSAASAESSSVVSAESTSAVSAESLSAVSAEFSTASVQSSSVSDETSTQLIEIDEFSDGLSDGLSDGASDEEIAKEERDEKGEEEDEEKDEDKEKDEEKDEEKEKDSDNDSDNDSDKDSDKDSDSEDEDSASKKGSKEDDSGSDSDSDTDDKASKKSQDSDDESAAVHADEDDAERVEHKDDDDSHVMRAVQRLAAAGLKQAERA